MSKLTVKCQEFEPWRSGTLRGFAILHINEMRLIASGGHIFTKQPKPEAQPQKDERDLLNEWCAA